MDDSKTYRCDWCGYVGPVYGTPFLGGGNSGVSAPWCPRCNLNNMLVECTTDAPQQESDIKNKIELINAIDCE